MKKFRFNRKIGRWYNNVLKPSINSQPSCLIVYINVLYISEILIKPAVNFPTNTVCSIFPHPGCHGEEKKAGLCSVAEARVGGAFQRAYFLKYITLIKLIHLFWKYIALIKLINEGIYIIPPRRPRDQSLRQHFPPLPPPAPFRAWAHSIPSLLALQQPRY